MCVYLVVHGPFWNQINASQRWTPTLEINPSRCWTPKMEMYFIYFQCGGPESSCIYLIPKRLADDLRDRNKITNGLQTPGGTER